VQASIFFQRCPLVGDLREICLVSGRCVFWGCIESSRTRFTDGSWKGARFSAESKAREGVVSLF
jgi:hypothetical protein